MPEALQPMTAAEIARHVQMKDISPVEVVDATLDRIDARNPSLNAFVHVDADGARAAARRLEERIMRGESVGRLAGVPVAMKDLFNSYPGWPATLGGIAALRDKVPSAMSFFPRRMEAADAIMIGATNSPVFGFRGTCDNALYGPTRNPFDTTRNSGGSSGGSAAAVADGLVPIGGATDGGGSIRIPSAWCNIFGFQPSYGRVPFAARPNAFEISPFAYNGALTRTVEDAVLALDALVGFDTADPFSLAMDLDLTRARHGSIEGVKIGFTRDLGIYPVDPDVAAQVERAVRVFASLGAEVVPIEIQLPAHAELTELWCRLVGMRMAGAIDGLKRMGIDLEHQHREQIPDPIWTWVDRANALSLREIRRDQVLRTLAYDGLQRALMDVDLIACPTVACVPVKNGLNGGTVGPSAIGTREIDPLIGWCLTYLTNLTGNPAASLPAGLVDGLPVGLQLIGRRLGDVNVLAACGAFEKAQPWAPNYALCEGRSLTWS